MSLDPPPYLASLQSNIRTRPIAWEGAVRAGTITDEQLNKIRAVDKVRNEQRKQTIERDVNGYQTLFLGAVGRPSILEAAIKRSDIVQNILVLLADLLEDVPGFSKSFSTHPKPYTVFVNQLSHSSEPASPIPLLTSTILTTLISSSPVFSNSELKALPELLKYLSSLTQSSDGGLQDIAVLQYSSLLRRCESRKIFWELRCQTIKPLIETLRAAAGTSEKDEHPSALNGASFSRSATDSVAGGGVALQLLYHVLLSLWQLSFEGSSIGKDLQDEYNIIPLYIQLVRSSPKEKITRLLLSTLYNILSTNRQTLLPVAVLARLPGLLQNISGRHFSDPDLLEDLKNLTETIEEYTKTQTTFDEYAAEINSGYLCWSPPHRSSSFWTENARKILDHENGALVKKIAEIMEKSWESNKQVLAIACNDIGLLVKEVPEKRTQLETLGLKKRVMELMTDPDESVRWESLNALSGWLKYGFTK